ncbi:MAG: phosphoribosyltransferase family protein [Cytophagales bacterium]|nr:phosphoribosyltransferase family protein [Cytophagales bacterium]
MTSSSQKARLLDQREVLLRIRRLAYQIGERHYKSPEIFLLGVHPQGALLSELLWKFLKEISPALVHRQIVRLKKKVELPSETHFKLNIQPEKIRQKPVVIVDDVLNTGRTTTHILHHLLPHNPSSIEVTVLVERKHTIYPVKASYSGIVLHDTLNNHVSVSLDDKKEVFLHP